jgi:hypothetical protein
MNTNKSKSTFRSTFRQQFLLLGFVMFAISGVSQLVGLLTGHDHGGEAWLTLFVCFGLAYLAYRDRKNLGKKDSRVA